MEYLTETWRLFWYGFKPELLLLGILWGAIIVASQVNKGTKQPRYRSAHDKN